MRSLSVKLVLAFCAVCIVEAALVAFFVRESNRRSFDKFIQEEAIQGFMEDAIAHYTLNNTWDGYQVSRPRPPHDILSPPPKRRPERRSSPPPGARPLPPPPDAPRQHGERRRPHSATPPSKPQYGLADTLGAVFMSNGLHEIGQQLTDIELSKSKPIIVDGQTIARVLLPAQNPPPNKLAVEFLDASDSALVYALLIALSISLLLGAWFTRTSLKPVRQLTNAISSLAKGQTFSPVSVRTKDEIGTLTGAFNQMNEELQKSKQLRLQMTADIAHELRTPLTVLTGYLEAFKDGDLKPSSERMATMYAESKHLQRLVEDLRLLSLADAGELPLIMEKCPPKSLLDQIAAKFSMQANEKQVSLHVEAQENLPEITIDPDRLTQVLSNLVSNALRYTPPAGTISLGALVQDKHLVLNISNSGEGISEEILPHIFERFYKADKSRKRHLQSTGLGLAIAKSLIEAHEGTISVQSALNKETIFSIHLPFKPTNPSSDNPHQTPFQ